jgi:hypothetical protein
MPRITYINLAPIEQHAKHASDRHSKDLMTLHETVSKDVAGISDIINTVKYLVEKGYGIHGMTDQEGHKAWARGFGTSEFVHAGGVNARSCGIENVSWIPYLVQTKAITVEQAWLMWMKREAQLSATAKLVAAWHASEPYNRPLVYSDGLHPGVTSHWDVSQHFATSDGHTDCWPHHKGGYYPILHVIELAKLYAKQGYTF